MSEIFSLELSLEPADSQWGDKAPLTFSGQGALIHLQPKESPANQLKQIQKAARRLASMKLPAIRLKGDWSLEQQWHVWQGAWQPQSMPAIEWADLSGKDKSQLDHRIRAFSWLKKVINQTPQEIYPEKLATDAGEFISAVGGDSVNYQVTTGEALLERELVGIHAVGRGSERPPALLELDFCPEGQAEEKPCAVLVGKGITFDSGGYSLKSSQGMLYMKADMGGAATVTAALALAIMNGLNKRVRLLLCCAENLVSGHAYKLADILKYKNGVSVEVVNTDAEGRLVLADGLILASEAQPDYIIDAATLTGAACVAVGEHYNALFAMDDEAAADMLKIAKKSHDPLWRLPLESFHQDECPSDYADTANSRPQPGGGTGGASNAAGFLSRFVKKPESGWLHMDLAGCFQDKAGALWAAGATGLGVQAIANFLLDLNQR